MKKLSDKERRFVAEYLIDQNGTQAAIRSGYSKRSAKELAHRLLTKAHIRAAIDEKLTKVEEKALVTKEYVLTALKDITERCMQREPVMEFDYVEKEMRQVTAFDPKTGKTVGVWEFDSSGANKAVENLGRHLKLFTDKQEVDISGGLAERIKKARERTKHKAA